jgi:hypothetical protein
MRWCRSPFGVAWGNDPHQRDPWPNMVTEVSSPPVVRSGHPGTGRWLGATPDPDLLVSELDWAQATAFVPKAVPRPHEGRACAEPAQCLDTEFSIGQLADSSQPNDNTVSIAYSAHERDVGCCSYSISVRGCRSDVTHPPTTAQTHHVAVPGRHQRSAGTPVPPPVDVPSGGDDDHHDHHGGKPWVCKHSRLC